MIKKYYSTNYINNNNKYIIINNSDKLFTIKEYNKIKNDYTEIKSTFNIYAFIEYLKSNKYLKCFDIKQLDFIK